MLQVVSEPPLPDLPPGFSPWAEWVIFLVLLALSVALFVEVL